MKEIILYVPVKSEDLSIYFRSAYMAPKAYFASSNNLKIEQSNYYLLATAEKNYYGNDCMLEIVVVPEEMSCFFCTEASKDVYYSFKPFPITRIKKVIMKNEERRDTMIVAIELNSAFLPIINNYFEVDSQLPDSGAPELNLQDKEDFTDQIRKFDKYLGAFALQKLSGEEYMNYSLNYFSNISFINSILNEGSHSENSRKCYLKDSYLIQNVFPYLTKEITENTILKLAEEEGQVITKNKFNGHIDFENLEGAPYILSILFSYGLGDDGKGLRADSLIVSNFQSNIKKEYSEVVAFCFGLYKGYYSLYKSYKVNDKEVNVKYRLNSKLDYYTIESVYQKCFNNKSISTFPYLDSWCPILGKKEKVLKTDFYVLDELVIGKKKPLPGSQDFLDVLFKEGSYVSVFKQILQAVILKVSDEIAESRSQDFEKEKQNVENILSENIKLRQKISDQDIVINELKNKIQSDLESDKAKTLIPGLQSSANEAKADSYIHQENFDEKWEELTKEKLRYKALLEKVKKMNYKGKLFTDLKDEVIKALSK
jgi:hypothetical protein